MISIIDNSAFKTIWNEIRRRYVLREAGKSLSTNDYTDEEKEKLRNVQDGAEVNDISQIQINTYKTASDAINNDLINSTSAVVGNRMAEIKLNLEENFGIMEASEAEIDELINASRSTSVMPNVTPTPADGGNGSSGGGSSAPSNVDTSIFSIKSETLSNIVLSGRQYVLVYASGREEKLPIPADSDTQYVEATVETAGLLSAADKTKLDSLDGTLDNFSKEQTKADTEIERMKQTLMDLQNQLTNYSPEPKKEVRKTSTEYKKGDTVTANNGTNDVYLECLVPGVTGTEEELSLSDYTIGSSVLDGTVTWIIKSTSEWQGRSMFEIDENGGLMPAEAVTYSDDFELDNNGDIMPKW